MPGEAIVTNLEAPFALPAQIHLYEEYLKAVAGPSPLPPKPRGRRRGVRRVMARLVALGDAHLGRTHLAHVRDEQGRNVREEDFLRSFAWAVDETIRLEPDGFLWLGDIFDHARPTYRTFAQVLAGLQQLTDAGLRGVAISGNHDTPRDPRYGLAVRRARAGVPERRVRVADARDGGRARRRRSSTRSRRRFRSTTSARSSTSPPPPRRAT